MIILTEEELIQIGSTLERLPWGQVNPALVIIHSKWLAAKAAATTPTAPVRSRKTKKMSQEPSS